MNHLEKWIRIRFAHAVALVLAVAGAVAVRAGEPAAGVRVMTFNLRYGTAKDGENAWEKRKDFLIETIRAFDPVLLGTQETLGFQRDALAVALPGHENLGVGREDGAERGEMTALFFRRDRFEKLEGGHFWLSGTPEKPGSLSWDSSLPRMATWVKLRDRRTPEAPPVFFVNTHFDHRGPRARLESARLLRARLATQGAGCRAIVTGDFNAGEGSAPYAALFGPAEGRASPVVDAYRVAQPERIAAEGTANGFNPAATTGARIDWIGAARDWTPVRVEIDRRSRGGRVPSDHFPVTAVLHPAVPTPAGP